MLLTLCGIFDELPLRISILLLASLNADVLFSLTIENRPDSLSDQGLRIVSSWQGVGRNRPKKLKNLSPVLCASIECSQ